MKIQPMSYKSYVWPFNPNQVEVAYSRNIQNLKLPLYGSILQDLGCDKRVVTGSGEFIGSGCMAEFNRLAAVFTAGESGLLRLPGDTPFPAAFASLKMIGEAQPDCVSYSFVFVEDDHAGSDGAAVAAAGNYVCIGSESLWEIANLYGTDVDTLKMLNPMIQWPNALNAGQKVVLP
nr:LysM domain-containing protein [uncultured Caproiciproducens sp.]